MTETLANSWFLTGPTAAGKTQVGLLLAERLGAEILSLDSMSIYRRMDIGTAKPSPAERAKIPHYLIDIVDPSEDFSLAQYLEAAEKAAAEVRSRGKEVLFVGGTPLYLKGLLRGICESPPADWEFRRQVAEEVATIGAAALHARLRQVDPLAAAKLHPNDQRRIIRALEVYRATGQPLTHRQLEFDEGRSAEERRVFVLHWPRAELHRRINARVEAMFAAGFVEEVRRLVEEGVPLGRTAEQAVGYQEILAHLQGEANLPATIAKVQARTRQFAKRQETWFRSLSECRTIELEEPLDANEVVERILQSSNG